jgi:meso-butanediol dehydrogenase / (S,S)-butanediol dehydrogenase / diacetyl reductase
MWKVSTVNCRALPNITSQVIDDKLEEVGAPKMEGKSQMESFALANTTLGRLSVPDDVAKAVSFLAGPDSDWVTGQVWRRTSIFRG